MTAIKILERARGKRNDARDAYCDVIREVCSPGRRVWWLHGKHYRSAIIIEPSNHCACVLVTTKAGGEQWIDADNFVDIE